MKRNSRLQTFKNWLIVRALTAASMAGSRLTLLRARRIGASLGRLARRVVRRERMKAVRNIATAFPELSSEARALLLRGVFEHLGKSLLEICWLPRLDKSSMSQTTTFAGLENLQAAVDHGKGVVLFTGHCGNWEWMAAAIGKSGFDMNVIARELYDSRINDFIVSSRGRHGVKTIGRGSGSSAREMLQTLRSGAILGVLIDQSIKAENTEVIFFGKSAPAPVGPARLAVKAGAAAIAGFIQRSGDQQLIRFDKPIFLSREDDPAELTRTMSRAIEEQIRSVPAEWVWMHDRWRPRKK